MLLFTRRFLAGAFMLVERAGAWEDMMEVAAGGIAKVTNGRKSGRQNAKKSQSGALYAVFYFIFALRPLGPFLCTFTRTHLVGL